MAKQTQIEKAILKCVRFARCPVSVIKMNDLAGRFEPTPVIFDQNETIQAINNLVAAKKLIRVRGDRAFGSVMAA